MTRETADREIARFLRAHRGAAERVFRSCGMYSGHPGLLFCIGREPGITQRQLADCLGIAPATAAVSLRRLEAAGLLRREPDAADRRALRLTLTPAGEDLMRRCDEGHDRLVAAQFEGFDEAELAALCALLDRMTQNLRRVETPEDQKG